VFSGEMFWVFPGGTVTDIYKFNRNGVSLSQWHEVLVDKRFCFDAIAAPILACFGVFLAFKDDNASVIGLVERFD